MAMIMMTARMNMTGTTDLGVNIAKMAMKTTVMNMKMTRMMTMRTWAMKTIEIMTGMRSSSSSSSDERKQAGLWLEDEKVIYFCSYLVNYSKFENCEWVTDWSTGLTIHQLGFIGQQVDLLTNIAGLFANRPVGWRSENPESIGQNRTRSEA